MLKNKNLQLAAIIITTLATAFFTSLLLEFTIFKHPVRYALVIITILIELFCGLVIVKYFTR